MRALQLEYLEPQDVRIWRPEGSTHLRVQIKDERVVLSARIKRIFPLSAPGAFVSIQDAAGKEVGILERYTNLDEDSRKLVEHELDRRYFTPRIEKIDLLRQEASMWRFVVQTQRGPAEFYVRNWRDSAHEIGPGRWQIQSVDGQRFEIVSLEALDRKSQLFLEQLL